MVHRPIGQLPSLVWPATAIHRRHHQRAASDSVAHDIAVLNRPFDRDRERNLVRLHQKGLDAEPNHVHHFIEIAAPARKIVSVPARSCQAIPACAALLFEDLDKRPREGIVRSGGGEDYVVFDARLQRPEPLTNTEHPGRPRRLHDHLGGPIPASHELFKVLPQSFEGEPRILDGVEPVIHCPRKICRDDQGNQHNDDEKESHESSYSWSAIKCLARRRVVC